MMEDFTKHESRRALTAELEVQKNYRELVPRPSEEDYQRLKESMARDGFDWAKPIVVNEDLVVLDGHTRLQIARELGLEWVYAITKDVGDHYAEKLYIIQRNLDQRHLNKAQLVELGLKLEEIEQDKAKERQRLAGELYGKSHPKLGQESGRDSNGDSNGSKLSQNSEQALNQGKALEHAARQVGVSRDTLWKGKKIKQAAQTDPQIAKSWDKAKQGKASVNQVYQEIQDKTGAKKAEDRTFLVNGVYVIHEELPENLNALKRMVEVKLPPTKYFPREEIMHWLYKVADHQGVPREDIDGAMQIEEEDIIARWNWAFQNLFDPKQAWLLTMLSVQQWREQQRAARPEEVPVPDNTRKLGPWPLDSVHRAGLADLVREFPAESTHLIYSDTVVDLEQVGLLGELAARALTADKYLCVYVDKRQLPEAMSRLSAAGLTYFWSCMVFRPDAMEVPELKIKEIWRLMLIYQKGETLSPGWDWFYDSVKSLHPTSRDMVRQLLKGLTMEGQMVVDPLVGSGITGQAARSLGRRFLCFGANEENVRAANQRIAEVRLVEENSK
ncbi:MAG: DNA methyltransferase [Candidatus Paceibacterota bacterium]|jgi:ParB-like chromosome segregation protein Spo0J